MASDEELGGEVSQADVDAAFSAASGAAGGDAAGSESESEPQAGLLSQADIDAAPGADGQPGDSASGELSQADVDAALASGKGDQSMANQSEQPEETRVDSAGNPFDDVAEAMAVAIEGEGPDAEQSAPDLPPEPMDMPDFSSPDASSGAAKQIDLLEDVELNVKIELGRTRMFVEDVLTLDEGSVVELDKLAGDPVDVFVNERLVARGEVLVLNDDFCVRINEIISQTGEAIRS